MKSRIVIFGNGELDKASLRELKATDYVIGVDRAAYWLLIQEVKPDVAIGDFDSTTSNERNAIKKNIGDVRVFSPKKNFTDLELAIDHAISLKPKEVLIYGVFGGRFDHALVAIELLEKILKHNVEAYIKDSSNEVSLLDTRRTINKSTKYKYVSLLSFTPKAVVTITGVQYPVAKHTFHRGQSLGISNQIIDKAASIQVHSGIAIVIRSRDKSR